MKKKILIFVLSLTSFLFFAQENLTVNLSDPIYDIIEVSQLKGLCNYVIGTKPYTVKQIKKAINEILSTENVENNLVSKTEIEYLNNYLDSLNKNNKDKKNNFYKVSLSNNREDLPISFNYNLGLETNASGGVYNLKERSQYGFDIIPSFYFFGDFGKNVSYRLDFFLDLTRMPLYYISDDYFVGYAWYDKGDRNQFIVDEYLKGFIIDGNQLEEPKRRTIKKVQNNSYLPFSYYKKWSGQMYLFSNMTASGLEGWPQTLGVSGGLLSEINISLLEDHFLLKMGRFQREWAAMDTGASLVLNAKAHPFFAAEFHFNIFSFLKFSSLFGGLEYPNQDYINKASWPSSVLAADEAYFFQNCIALNMIELDFKYFHFDFGSSSIIPKRIELGYMFPLMNAVEYQNHIGDYDNTALFGNLKFKIPNYGSIWASLFLDELNGFNNNPFTATRNMFAGQLGTKIVLPFLSFANISMRYTKVEPYCYTHQAIKYTPWYNNYIMENYTNNGESIGYYLPPNADEFYFNFSFKPSKNILSNIQYQFIRHGADYGSQQVPGSSLYSELSPFNRDELKKYFLRDGAYNWMHIVSVSSSIESKNSALPFMLYGTAGFMFSYYTAIDNDIYNKRHEYGNNGNSGANRYTKYNFINTDEYPMQVGGTLSFGIKFLFW